MSDARFKALRDRGTDLWTEIEAHRLAQESRIVRRTRLNLYLSLASACAGVVAGASGAKLFGDLGYKGAWIIGTAGFVAALAAALNPILKLSEEVQKSTSHAQQLKSLQDMIRNHIYRMQVQDTFTVEDQQLFFEQRADDLRTLEIGTTAQAQAFQDAAAAARDRNNFPKLDYVGAEKHAQPESVQRPADDLVAFGMGG